MQQIPARPFVTSRGVGGNGLSKPEVASGFSRTSRVLKSAVVGGSGAGRASSTVLPVAAALLLVILLGGCGDRTRQSTSPAAAQSSPSASRGAAGPAALKVTGTRFVRADGSPFEWRGITAFRLLEMEAAGRIQDVDAYLAWASVRGLTVVRVLAMAKHLFELPPDRGVAHLDAFLTRAASHGLYVEVVALADTGSYPIDPAAHVDRVGRICAQHPNALLEIANEPYHQTQLPAVRDYAVLRSLLGRVPDPVVTALGAPEFPELLADGDYATIHASRSSGARGWGHVRDLSTGRELLARAGKPVINDEPIGAGPRYQPGRRDDSPERFRAAALMSRMIGLGATFHYEDGLQAALPQARELECFDAWQEAWQLLPASLSDLQLFRPGEAGSPVHAVTGAPFAGAYVAVQDTRAWLLVFGTEGRVTAEWTPGWTPGRSVTWDQSMWSPAVR